MTSIGRGLKERTKLENIVERLSRNLSSKDMSKTLNRQLVAAASSKIEDRTLLVVDLSDIQKPYGRSMEHLGRVRDGSSGKTGPGYWNLNVVATDIGSRDVLPLWGGVVFGFGISSGVEAWLWRGIFRFRCVLGRRS